MRKNYKPKEIIVAGTKFDIVYKTMKDFGELDFDERKIYVSNKIKGEVLLDTIIHAFFFWSWLYPRRCTNRIRGSISSGV